MDRHINLTNICINTSRKHARPLCRAPCVQEHRRQRRGGRGRGVERAGEGRAVCSGPWAVMGDALTQAPSVHAGTGGQGRAGEGRGGLGRERGRASNLGEGRRRRGAPRGVEVLWLAGWARAASRSSALRRSEGAGEQGVEGRRGGRCRGAVAASTARGGRVIAGDRCRVSRAREVRRFGEERAQRGAGPHVSGGTIILWRTEGGVRHRNVLFCGARSGGCATEL